MATLLVIGASRGIGLETVRRALAAGHRVRALARGAAPPSTSISRAWRRLPATRPRCDCRDTARSRARMRSSSRWAPASCAAGRSSPAPRSSRGATRILIDAMRATGVRRLGRGHRAGCRRQPRARRLSLRCADLPLLSQAHLRRQGRAGADDPSERARVDDRASRVADRAAPPPAKRARWLDPDGVACWLRQPRRRGRTSWCARPSSAASSARRRSSSDDPLGRRSRASSRRPDPAQPDAIDFGGRILLANQGGALPSLLAARGLAFGLWNRRVVGSGKAAPWPPAAALRCGTACACPRPRTSRRWRCTRASACWRPAAG